MRCHETRGRIAAVACICLTTISSTAAGARDRALTIWFDSPSPAAGAGWEERGLPIGNGFAGAMIGGGLSEDVIQLNEKSLWTGGPGSAGGYRAGNWQAPRPDALAAVRKRLANGGSMTPEELAPILGEPVHAFGAYQTFGNLVLRMTGSDTAVHDYRRSLAIDDGVATVSYVRNSVGFRRDYFASYPDRIIAVRLTADRPASISFDASFAVPDNRSRGQTALAGRITMAGALTDNGERYEGQALVLPTGGTRTDNPDGSVTIRAADSALILIALGTDYAPAYPRFRGDDPHPAISAALNAAASVGWDRLLARHQSDFRSLFDRVKLDIGQQLPDWPAEKLLWAYRGTGSSRDRGVEALYFQYGRYLLIASSRPGALPANLQGVWNYSTSPPWEADYHVNINTEMNYWPANTTNLSETAIAFQDWVQSLRAPGRQTARAVFGSPGWVTFLNSNVWGYTGLIDYPTAFWFPESAAWLAMQVYDQYRFSPDPMTLRNKVYPLLQETLALWRHELQRDAAGRLLASPTFSPEHGPITAGAAMSQQLIAALLRDTREAAIILGKTSDAQAAADLLKRVDPGTKIGNWGQLQEWQSDIDNPADTHRHLSQLFGLYPGDAISRDRTPALAEAARVSLVARGDFGLGRREPGIGWSRAWKIGLFAHLGDGVGAHRVLTAQLSTSTNPNLLNTHPPFQIDGNLGSTAGIAETLLQSGPDGIDLLPALFPTWGTGSVSGLRARGGISVAITWANGSLTTARVRPDHDGPITLNRRNGCLWHVTDDGGRDIPCRTQGFTCSFDATAGIEYSLRFSRG